MVAFWLTPEYVVIPVKVSHIETVIEHPEIFPISPEQIRAVYERHREVVRTEGRARQEIIRDLVAKGFVRLRRYRHPEYWSVNLPQISANSLEVLQQFFWLLCQGRLGWRETDRQVPVILDAVGERRQIVLQDLLADYSYEAGFSRPGLRMLGEDRPAADRVGAA
jgi:hypothetical protein